MTKRYEITTFFVNQISVFVSPQMKFIKIMHGSFCLFSSYWKFHQKWSMTSPAIRDDICYAATDFCKQICGYTNTALQDEFEEFNRPKPRICI